MSGEHISAKGCRPFTDEEVDRLMACLTGARDRALVVVGLYLGARISEALNLDVADVAEVDASGRIRIRNEIVFRRATTKGRHTSRAIKTHAEVRKALLALFEARGTDAGPLFLATGRGRLKRGRAWKLLKAACDRAAIHDRVGTHSLRKTFGLRTYRAKKDIRLVQALLGHADLRDTILYIAVDEPDLHDAIDSLPSLDPERGLSLE